MSYREKHENKILKLEEKLNIAEMKREERVLRMAILKTYLPQFSINKLNIKFTKLSVIISFVAVCVYTTAAILLQKYISIEVSPTLTMAVFAFFGTELVAVTTIKNISTTALLKKTENQYTENL